MKERVHRVVASVLGVPVDRLSDDDGPDTLDTWDSSSHLTLVLALEAEFGVSFSDEDITDMISVGLVRSILADRLGGPAAS